MELQLSTTFQMLQHTANKKKKVRSQHREKNSKISFISYIYRTQRNIYVNLLIFFRSLASNFSVFVVAFLPLPISFRYYHSSLRPWTSRRAIYSLFYRSGCSGKRKSDTNSSCVGELNEIGVVDNTNETISLPIHWNYFIWFWCRKLVQIYICVLHVLCRKTDTNINSTKCRKNSPITLLFFPARSQFQSLG